MRIFLTTLDAIAQRLASGWIAPVLLATCYLAALFFYYGDCALVHSPYVLLLLFFAYCALADGTLFLVR